MNNKVLIFTTRHLCYNSGDFFAAQLAEGFEQNGIECEYCNLEFEDTAMGSTGVVESSSAVLTEDSVRQLESFLGKSYLAVIDFNSRMPHMILDDGSFYLDGIDAPFYDYILDHPLYHHSTLSCQLRNFNVIVPDRNQRDYVREHYSWIRDVIWQPLGGQAAVNACPHDMKREEVLFTGTYRNPEEVYNQIIQTGDAGLRGLMMDMTDYMLMDSSVTVEDAMTHVLNHSLGSELSYMSNQNGTLVMDGLATSDFPALLNACYPVEIYIRNLYRERLIDTFAKEGVHLRIVGNWWEQYAGINRASIILQPAVSFARSFDIIAGSAVLLDSSPFFQYGIHDRVVAAMANKTIALTDEKPYISSLCKDKVDCGIQTYSAAHPETAVVRAEEFLSKPSLRKETAEAAYEFYESHFTWKCAAAKLLAL